MAAAAILDFGFSKIPPHFRVGHGSFFFLNITKSSNQMSKLTMLSVFTGPPDITQLIYNRIVKFSSTWHGGLEISFVFNSLNHSHLTSSHVSEATRNGGVRLLAIVQEISMSPKLGTHPPKLASCIGLLDKLSGFAEGYWWFSLLRLAGGRLIVRRHPIV